MSSAPVPAPASSAPLAPPANVPLHPHVAFAQSLRAIVALAALPPPPVVLAIGNNKTKNCCHSFFKWFLRKAKHKSIVMQLFSTPISKHRNNFLLTFFHFFSVFYCHEADG